MASNETSLESPKAERKTTHHEWCRALRRVSFALARESKGSIDWWSEQAARVAEVAELGRTLRRNDKRTGLDGLLIEGE